MKKTIAVLCLMAAAVASADTLGTSTFDRSGTTVSTVTVSTTGEILSLSLEDLTVNGAEQPWAINMGMNGNASRTATFTLSPPLDSRRW